jgi:hypothetical protein
MKTEEEIEAMALLADRAWDSGAAWAEQVSDVLQWVLGDRDAPVCEEDIDD